MVAMKNTRIITSFIVALYALMHVYVVLIVLSPFCQYFKQGTRPPMNAYPPDIPELVRSYRKDEEHRK